MSMGRASFDAATLKQQFPGHNSAVRAQMPEVVLDALRSPVHAVIQLARVWHPLPTHPFLIARAAGLAADLQLGGLYRDASNDVEPPSGCDR